MKKRLNELDILRGIAFILVVIQHMLGGYSYSKKISISNKIISRFVYVVAQPAVPIFLVLTGMCLTYVYFKKLNTRSFYIKKLKYLVMPYICLSFLNIWLLDKSKLQNFIAQLLTGNSGYHLWYMALILRVYVFFPLIILIIRKICKMNLVFKKSFFILYSKILQDCSRSL
jgi:probable poly-beta-1,6-N-acetyl-D-glucosamine export protein